LVSQLVYTGGMILFFLLCAVFTFKERKSYSFQNGIRLQAESSRLQYTSSSYASPFFRIILQRLSRDKLKLESLKRLFPAEQAWKLLSAILLKDIYINLCLNLLIGS